MKDYKNNLIIIYGGIGDSLLWIPVLKAFEVKPDVVFLYQTPEIKILKENNLIRNAFKIKNKFQLVLFCLKHFKVYENIYLNHLCGGSFLMKMGSYCAKDVVTNSRHYSNDAIPTYSKKVVTKFIPIINDVHDSIQNYFLVHKKTPQFSSSDFELQIKPSHISLPASFIAVQLSAGNNQTLYKNWPINQWAAFFELVCKKYPDQKFVLLGSKDEESLASQLYINNGNIISLIGKTTIDETFAVIKKSNLFIGLDGGLLHVAVACNKPTFTIWGGSSTILYGYNSLLGSKHCEVKQNLNCMPCNAWQNANTSKTKDPLLCPDFACLQTLSPAAVFKNYMKFIVNFIE